MEKLRLVILISGRGSNMEAIIKSCIQNDDFPAEVCGVVSNKPDAYGLEVAHGYNIPAVAVDHKLFDQKTDFESALHEKIESFEPDAVCLAGFMRLLSADFVKKWDGRILNIHPSLLPKYKGLNTYQRAIDAGDETSGCTVHIVTAEMDSGPVLVQRSVPIIKGDTVETLASRILEEEHKAYPEAIVRLSEALS